MVQRDHRTAASIGIFAAATPLAPFELEDAAGGADGNHQAGEVAGARLEIRAILDAAVLVILCPGTLVGGRAPLLLRRSPIEAAIELGDLQSLHDCECAVSTR